MVFWKRTAVIAGLASVSGCTPTRLGTVAPVPVTWTRSAQYAPWWMAGVTPTASAIEYTLDFDAFQIDLAECPFHQAQCLWSRTAPPRPRTQLKVDQLRCTPLAEYQDHCTFRLTESVQGHASVRSRCAGYFTIVGTSEEPSRWSIDYHVRDEPGETPALVCRRGRSTRRAVS